MADQVPFQIFLEYRVALFCTQTMVDTSKQGKIIVCTAILVMMRQRMPTQMTPAHGFLPYPNETHEPTVTAVIASLYGANGSPPLTRGIRATPKESVADTRNLKASQFEVLVHRLT